jgi:hypothetical protein
MSNQGRFTGMSDDQIRGILSGEGHDNMSISEYFSNRENVRRQDETNAAVRETIAQVTAEATAAVHQRWSDWAERRWEEVFKDAGIPFEPKSLEDIELPQLAITRHPLPGWKELVSLEGSNKIPYVDAYGTRKNFTPEIREGRRDRAKEIKKATARLKKNPTSGELKKELRDLEKLQASYEPVVQALQIMDMLDRVKLFVEVWETRCLGILEWEAFDVKKHKDLPEFIKDEIKARQIQENRWREAGEPKTEPAPKSGLMEREVGGTPFVQKFRNRPVLGEDGHIYGSPEEAERGQERDESDPLEWLDEA